MFDLILACTKNFGIGKNGNMPWHDPEELSLFRNKTRNCVVIVGRKTLETLPKLPERFIICVSKNTESKIDSKNSFTLCNSVENALEKSREMYPQKNIFVIGGKSIYEECFKNHRNSIWRLHISFMKKDYDCDTFLNLSSELKNWVINLCTEKDAFVHWEMSQCNNERGYLNLLKEVMNEPERETRNGKVVSKFYSNLSFDLRKGFPLLTTKKMFLRGIIEELLFFLRGDTDTTILEKKGINIWKGNTSREFLNSLGMTDRKVGNMGPMYGYQWRFYGKKYGGNNEEKGIDQLEYVVNTIKKDPYSRRIIMTDYNPAQAFDGVLFPCHSLMVQFYVTERKEIDMFCYNRSQDLFLGTPFNIASSALLLTIIAKLCGLIPRFLHMSLGDVHIYESHYEAVKEQLSRHPYSCPRIFIHKKLETLQDVENLKYEDFELQDYRCYSAIKAEMVA